MSEAIEGGYDERHATARWALSFSLIVLAHIGLGAVLLAHGEASVEGVPTDAIAVDLSPEPTTTSANPEEPPGPEVTEASPPSLDPVPQSEPDTPAPDSPPPVAAEASVSPQPESVADAVPPRDLPPMLSVQAPAEVTLPTKPEEPQPRPVTKPLERAERKQRKLSQTAPSQARAAAAEAAQGGGRPSTAMVASWKGKLVVHLARFKRYPADAQARRKQGTAMVRFTINHAGRVVSRTLVRGSGDASLDQESLAMLQRAQPLPAPPPNMPGPIVLDLPVRFSIR